MKKNSIYIIIVTVLRQKKHKADKKNLYQVKCGVKTTMNYGKRVGHCINTGRAC